MSAVTYLPPVDPASLLTVQRRARDLESLSNGVDVLVVGGGITGVGVALDAASRGMSVALVERDDLACGTSRWSSKLVHGGLRYLAKGDVTVAWESAIERAVVAGRLAPHLIHALPQVVPSFEEDRASARLAMLGFRAGDAMRVAARTRHGMLPGARHISADEALLLVPGLRREGLLGAALGWDCQLEDDARLVVAVARTAAAYGARIITRARVESIDPGGGVAQLVDGLTDKTLQVKARWIVNATGVWADTLDPSISLEPSLGTHVVVPSALLGSASASLTVAVPGHVGRFVFTLPQPDGVTYIGLTDNELDGPVPDVPVAPVDDIDWILDIVSTALRRPLTRDDVIGSFAGVRPLVKAVGESSADISRKHLVKRDGALITVTGGKLTTYRRMAQDVVDQMTEDPCRTRDLALIGAGPRPEREDVPERLWRRYGNEAPQIWDLGRDDQALREPIPNGYGVLGVEIAFGVAAELAITADDLVDRRTRVGLITDSQEFRAEVQRRLRAAGQSLVA